VKVILAAEEAAHPLLIFTPRVPIPPFPKKHPLCVVFISLEEFIVVASPVVDLSAVAVEECAKLRIGIRGLC
jgi:hypothetical protein